MLVSVIIPFYNAERFLAETIESVLAQTYSDWELILVDDGSTDGSTRVAQLYSAEHPDRIRYVEHPGHVNAGVSVSRNLGIETASGDLIALLDADDLWNESKLDDQINLLLQHPEVGMVYGLALYWSSWNRSMSRSQDYVLRSAAHVGKVVHPPRLAVDSYPLGEGAAPCPSDLLLRREVIERVGGFEPSFTGPLQLYEDQAFLAKVYLATPVFVSDKVWIKYRQHPDSCVATVSSAGRYHHVRLHFLEWLAVYLKENGYTSPSVWRALRRALWLERHPHSRAMLVRVQRLSRRIRTTLSHSAPVRMIRSWRQGKGLVTPPGWVRFGSLRRTSPISRVWGRERGRSLDRYYIENFLQQHADDVRGRVLEVGDAFYTRRFGGDRVTQSDVLHVEEGNPEATIVADLASADHIPSDAFDCIILTQTLQLIYDVPAALRTLRRILKPGGVLLTTFPGITHTGDADWQRTWFWSFTTNSARRLFHETFGADNSEIRSHGNVLAAAAFLYGLADRELRREELDHHDPAYDVVITVRAVKPLLES